MIPLPTKEILDTLLSYCAESGELRWKVKPCKNVLAGAVAGNLKPTGYTQVRLNGKYYFSHRLIWRIMTGDDPGDLEVDHRDGVKHNNKWDNLRLATPSQNQFNKSNTSRNTSGVKGVTWVKRSQKWQAAFQVYNKSKTIGLYNTIEEAQVALMAAREYYHKTFTNHGSNKQRKDK